MPSPAARHASTLAGATLRQVAVGVTVALALASVVGHQLIYREIEQRVIAQLNQYVVQRSRNEDEVFRLARDLQHAIRDTVLARLDDYRTPRALARFDELFERGADGAVRSRHAETQRPLPVTGWLHRDTPLTDELRQRMVLFYDVVQQFKPSALVRFTDIYFTAPEQLNLGTDPPGLTLWAMTVPADFDQNSGEWAQITDRAHNPTRETAWTGVYIDPVWNRPMVTVATPIDHAGRHLGSISFDHLIDELIESLLATGMTGANHAVFQADGRLIAHSSKMQEIAAAQGQLYIPAVDDPELTALYNAVRGNVVDRKSGYDAVSDQYFAIGRLTGPSWYYASSIPGNRVRKQAFAASQWVLWSGLAAFALLVPALMMILRQRIAVPLAGFTAAAERIAAGEQISHLATERHAELARLAGAFNHMADRIAERDAALRDEKRELEAALADRHNTDERWRAMTAHLSDFIVVLDGDLRNIYVSPNMHQILGYSAEERLGNTGFDLVHPNDLAALHEQIRLALDTPGVSTRPFRYRMRCRDGQFKTLEATWTNLLDKPAIRGIISNVRDVTEIVRAEVEIAQQREALYQAEKLSAMGSLLAGVAHELNNPLSVVVGRATILQEEASDPETQRVAQKIRIAAERCARIVKSFLAMARRQRPNFAPVHLAEVLDGALEMVEYNLRTQDIRIERRYADELPVVQADADQLHQVFVNMFVNAQHAMAESAGERHLRVDVRRNAGGDSVLVEVRDTGTGMTPEVLARAFDPYFTTKPLGKGTGVGLSVSLGIVRAHGGDITARNLPEGGTCITVTLPVGTLTDTGAVSPRREAEPQPARRVLVVDDELEVAATLVEILRYAGHSVDFAPGGRAALELLREARHDIVITDIRMPEFDGRQLYAEITRQWPALASRVIFMTGDNLSTAVAEFLAQSGRAIIEKPFVPVDVRRVVRAVAVTTPWTPHAGSGI